MLSSPWVAAAITLLLSLIWMRGMNYIASKSLITSATSRKIIHIGTGPIFVICWILFPEISISKYLAALIPFLIVLQLAFVGLGIIKDDSSIKAMSRTGMRKELLRGPLFYGIVFVLTTILFWKSLTGIFALMILCGGDGFADLVGSRFNKGRLFKGSKKTLSGSAAMFLGGWLLSTIVALLFILMGNLPYRFGEILVPALVVSFAATIIEALSPSDYDNFTVPLVTIIASLLIL